MPVFRSRIELDHPVEDVFAYHTRPGAFERLSPPWEGVRVVRKRGGIEPGGEVLLELRKGPARLRWALEHTQYEENRLFVDEQQGAQGPVASWRHEHRFEALGSNRSALSDVVTFAPPLGKLGEVVGEAFIARSLARLFRFREVRLNEDLNLHARLRSARPERPWIVAITGASGFLGSALRHLLTTGGHEVRVISRSSRAEIPWDPARGVLEKERLEGVDAVVHLAGESISGGRWTQSKKKAILDSRVHGTRLLSKALAALQRPPHVFISGSAVGIYGDRGDEILTEASGRGQGFLADVCDAWEGAAGPARDAGIRTVLLRTGVVLSPDGGVLGTMLPPFLLGVGGRVGSGRAFMPWIDRDDWLALVIHAMITPELSGPVNATAPTPVTQATFTDVLGRVLVRPTLIPLPALAVRGLFGEMGQALLLEGQRARPQAALGTDFSFQRPDLEDALRMQLGRDRIAS
jgi:uncharacterized protein (TIGR01777 family)